MAIQLPKTIASITVNMFIPNKIVTRYIVIDINGGVNSMKRIARIDLAF